MPSFNFKSTKLLTLAGIILIAILTRFWRLSALFHWTLDEEFWAYTIHNIATGYHFPLIGGHIAGTGVYSGPLFVWLLAPWFFLTGSHPLAIAFLVSSVGVITTILIFYLLNLDDRLQALLASLLYASSTLVTLYDRKFWNASATIILSVITLYLINQLRSRPSLKLVWILAFITSLATHAHATGFVLLLFVLFSFPIYRFSRRHLFHFIIVFLILQTPLVLFDLRHNFTNTRALTAMFTQSSPPVSDSNPQPLKLTTNTFARLLFTPASDISNELTHCTELTEARSLPGIPFSILATIVLFYALSQLKSKNPYSLLLFTNLVLLFAYSYISPQTFYAGQSAEYFLLPSFASFLILTAGLLHKLYKHRPLPIAALVLLLITINLHVNLNLTHTHGFAAKNQLVQTAIKELGQTQFSLNVTGHSCQIYGYRYLFTLYNHEPTQSYLDPSFAWLYQNRLPLVPAQKHLSIDADSATIKITDANQEITPPPPDSDSQR